MNNYFSEPSRLPYGLPDFSAFSYADLRPAFDAALVAHRAQVESIACNPSPANVRNVLHALEASGQELARVLAVAFNAMSTDATAEIQELEAHIGPALAAHQDDIHLDTRLYDRLIALRELELDEEDAWLLHRLLQDFERAGILLDDAGKATMRDLNGQLAALEAEFSRLSLAGLTAAAVHFSDASQLEGLADDALAAAAEAAQRSGKDGYVIELSSCTSQACLASLTRRDSRMRVQLASIGRGSGGDENDTRAVVLSLARLRAKKARLLGFENYAAFVAADACAGSSDAVMGLLAPIAAAATRNASREAETLAALAASSGTSLEPWDWQYLSARVAEQEFGVNDDAMRDYFELEQVLHAGVFAAASALYGITFASRPDLRGYHEDVRVFEVFEADGTGLGLFLFDPYTRPAKRGGAWMNNLVEANGLLGQQPVVVNNHNITRPPAGSVTLLTWDEVTTLFHEFGHALHGLFADTRYPSLAGTNTPRDFVEYPSQVNEMWAWDPKFLAAYARHWRTGEAIPNEFIASKLASRLWGEGFRTSEYVAAALLDLAWHTLAPQDVPAAVADVEAFQSRALAAAGVDMALVPPRYSTAYFQHIWAGDYYAAAYYAYIWSEAMDADTAAWFESHGGANRENGQRFRRELLSRGGAVNPLVSFRRFIGRDVDVAPLLARRGLN